MDIYENFHRIFSVPIRGLFNLTKANAKNDSEKELLRVSVPIRGLFNLTGYTFGSRCSKMYEYVFPSPSGDYLI